MLLAILEYKIPPQSALFLSGFFHRLEPVRCWKLAESSFKAAKCAIRVQSKRAYVK